MRRVWLSSAIALCLAATVARADLVKLEFAPRPAREVIQRVTTRTVTRVVGDSSRRVVLQETGTRVRFERAGKGWRMLATLVSGRTLRDGVETPDPMIRALLGRTLVYRLGPEARVESIEGFDAAIQALLDSMPAESRAATASLLNADALRQREIHDFEARITEWVGPEVKDGDEVQYKDVYPLPSGAMVLYARTHIGPIELRDGRRRVTIRTAFESDSTSLRGLLQRAVSGVAALAGLDTLRVDGPRVVGTLERVVDAATLDIVTERSERVIHMRVNVAGRGPVAVVRTEHREWAFEEVAPARR